MTQLIERPSAWLPVAMSLGVLAMVLATIAVSGTARRADEGAQAHIFQIWLVLELVGIATFAIEWLPRNPREAIGVLAIQVLTALTACAPVFYLGW